MKRYPPLSVPLSLVFTSPKPQLNFHLVIHDQYNLTRTKVCEDIAIVAPLVFCANNVRKILLMVRNNLIPGLGERSLFREINNSFHSFLYFFSNLVKCVNIG